MNRDRRLWSVLLISGGIAIFMIGFIMRFV